MNIELIPDEVWQVNVFCVSRPPKNPGVYLLLCFEWVGMQNEKPGFPSWHVKQWDGKHWSRKQYTWDTGNYESFIPVAWCDMPPVSWT